MSRKVAGIEDSRKTALGNWNKVSKYMYNLGRHQLVNINGSQVGNVWCLSRGLCAPLHRGELGRSATGPMGYSLQRVCWLVFIAKSCGIRVLTSRG